MLSDGRFGHCVRRSTLDLTGHALLTSSSAERTKAPKAVPRKHGCTLTVDA